MKTSHGEQAKLRILVVDDNQDAADSFARLLVMLGYEAIAVYDGHSSLAQASHWQPQLVLLDLNLPDLAGYEVAKRMRNVIRDEVRIVAVTGWMRERNNTLLDQAGFDGFLTKPIPIGDIIRFFPQGKRETPELSPQR